MKGIFSSKSLIGSRIILSLLCICILFIASGCDGTNYKKAIKLYENGSWDEAATIFEQLGDYEDSMAMVDACNYGKANELYENGEYGEAIKIFSDLSGYSDSTEMIAKCKWSLFVDYIQKNKKLEYNADSSYTVTIEADGNNIIACYSLNTVKNSAGNVSLQYTATFSFGDPVAHLNASGEVTILSAQMKDTCACEWDINNYKTGDEIEWTTYDKLEAAEKQYEKALLVDSILIKNYEQISTGAISELVSIRTAYEWYYSTYLAAVLDVLTTTSAATDKVINISDIDLANSYVAICRSDNRVDIYFRCGDNTIYGMQCWPSRGYVQAGTVESNMLITEYVELLSEGNIIDEYTHIPISDLSEAFDDISDVISD